MGKEEKPSLLENIVFYAVSLILAGLLGYLVFLIFKDGGSPADIQVNVQKSQDKNCVFEVYLKNTGETTAENVNIVLDLYSGWGEGGSGLYHCRLFAHPIGTKTAYGIQNPQRM